MEEDEIKLNPGFVDNDKFGNKDFNKYAYFVSKAKNMTFVMKARLERRLDNGEIDTVDEGLKIEFHNGMKRIEKTPENKAQIEFLRKKVESEKELQETKKSIKEVKKPVKMYTEEEVAKLLEKKEKDKEKKEKDK